MLPALLPTLLPILGGVLEKVIPDPQARDKTIGELLGKLQASDLAQLDVNKAEAQSQSLFVAGWRPGVGWVCVAAMAYQYLLHPLGVFACSLIDETLATQLLNAPRLDGTLWELLFALLGLGGLRTFEKLKGVAR